MKRVVLVILFLAVACFAEKYSYAQIVNLYKNKEYLKTCEYGATIFRKFDNTFASIVGDACAKEDYINVLGDIVKRLNKTKIDRSNASYFATLILEKKLIYQFMNDKIDLSGLSLPKTDHILSRVFEKLAKKQYKIVDKNSMKIKIIDGDYKYIMWLSPGKLKKVYIDEYKNNELVKRHWFL